MDGIKIFLAIVVVFLLSLIQSCTELRLSLGGKRDKATVQDVLVEVKKGTHVETGKFLVKYYFTAQDGETLREFNGEYTTNRAEAESRQKGDKIDMIYLASKPQINRIVGHRQWIWVVLLVVMTGAGVGYGAWLYKKA